MPNNYCRFFFLLLPVYFVLNCTFIPKDTDTIIARKRRLLGAVFMGSKRYPSMQASLVRGHQWITSVNVLPSSSPLLFLYNLSSDLLTRFSILHVKSTATTEICSTCYFSNTWLISNGHLYKWLKHPAVVCTDAITNLSSAVPPCPGLTSQSGFPSRILRKEQAGKLTTSELMLSGKRLWKYVFTTWWKSNI